MTSLTLLNIYVMTNLLIVLAAAVVAALRRLSDHLPEPMTPMAPMTKCHQLQVANILSAVAVLLPWVALLAQRGEVFTANAQVWSGTTMQHFISVPAAAEVSMSVAATQLAVPLHAAGMLTSGLLLGGGVLFLWLVGLDAGRIRRILGASHVLARSGSLRVLAAPVTVPFSFWVPGRNFIVVPTQLTQHPDDLRIALRHEAQHHRQLDTRWVYFHQLLRALCWLNPAAHWLRKSVADLQEFACDEALITRRKVSVQAYCECLLRVAESALQRRCDLSCASMLGGPRQSMLRSRVEALLCRRAAPARRSLLVAASVTLLTLTIGVAVAASTTVQDRRISLQEARAMAQRAQAGSDFPIAVNERVLKELNRLLGTPDGRTWLRESLQRMQQYQPLIAQKTAQYGLPAELLAVPLAESGFRNRPPSANPAHGAGLWMFIAPTARRFGLEVSERTDERLDVAAETDAAMRMFASLNQSFADWGLTLLAYNAGARRVQQAIDATGSRDVWHIVAQGYENDADYVARVMAAVLIIRNPQAIE